MEAQGTAEEEAALTLGQAAGKPFGTLRSPI